MYLCRCVSPNDDNTTDFPGLCKTYYDHGYGYLNESVNHFQSTLWRINKRFQTENNSNPCVDFMLYYLCHYYFPLCNLTTGEVTPVCSSSCAVVKNNEDCSILKEIVYEELELDGEDDISALSGTLCLQTHRSYVNMPPISENCLLIKG